MFHKDPDDVIDLTLDLTPWLGSNTISSQSTDSRNVTIDSAAESNGIITATLSGGTAESNAWVDFTANTSNSKTIERRINFKVETQ